MKKSKKGFTLIELIVSLMVLAMAVLAGTQLFSAAGYGYSNSARLSGAVEELSSTFDAGAPASAMPDGVTYSQSSTKVKVKLPGAGVFNEDVILINLLYDDGQVRTQLYGLKNSYGSGN